MRTAVTRPTSWLWAFFAWLGFLCFAWVAHSFTVAVVSMSAVLTPPTDLSMWGVVPSDKAILAAFVASLMFLTTVTVSVFQDKLAPKWPKMRSAILTSALALIVSAAIGWAVVPEYAYMDDPVLALVPGSTGEMASLALITAASTACLFFVMELKMRRSRIA